MVQHASRKIGGWEAGKTRAGGGINAGFDRFGARAGGVAIKIGSEVLLQPLPQGWLLTQLLSP